MQINRLASEFFNSVVTSHPPIGRDFSTHVGSNAWAFSQCRDELNALFSHSNPATFHGACQDLTERTWAWSEKPGLSPPARACFEETSRLGAELTRLNCNFKVAEVASAPHISGALTLADFARPDHLHAMREACQDRQEASQRVADVLSPAGRQYLAAASRSTNLLGAARSGELSAAEMLALVDYVHPDTGTFAAVTLCQRAALSGMPHAAAVLKPLNAPLESAVNKLSCHPNFRGDPRATLYKGMRLSTSGQEVFTSAAAQGVPYSFGHVLSATSDVSSLYGPERGNKAALVIHNAPHAKVDEFHPDSTASQSECIVPAEHTWRTRLTLGASKGELESLLFAKNIPASGVFTARCG